MRWMYYNLAQLRRILRHSQHIPTPTKNALRWNTLNLHTNLRKRFNGLKVLSLIKITTIIIDCCVCICIYVYKDIIAPIHMLNDEIIMYCKCNYFRAGFCSLVRLSARLPSSLILPCYCSVAIIVRM